MHLPVTRNPESPPGNLVPHDFISRGLSRSWKQKNYDAALCQWSNEA